MSPAARSQWQLNHSSRPGTGQQITTHDCIERIINPNLGEEKKTKKESKQDTWQRPCQRPWNPLADRDEATALTCFSIF